MSQRLVARTEKPEDPAITPAYEHDLWTSYAVATHARFTVLSDTPKCIAVVWMLA